MISKTVFINNDQATSAITGIYSSMANSTNFASGGNASVTCLSGASADEFVAYSTLNLLFYENDLIPEYGNIESIYSSAYRSIYSANSVLEGLSGENGVTPATKMQLEGEALFIRAFCYFYLVNLYGPVPLQLTTDNTVTQIASRSPEAEIYKQIVKDLTSAETLLSESYPSAGKVRPNKSTAHALLARTYLYLKDWDNAEKFATQVIVRKPTYDLIDPNAVFLANSQEAIWQIMPPANSNTNEGSLFILTATPLVISLTSNFANTAFEANDKRKTAWVKSFTNNTGTYYYPNKYKVRSSTTVTEYSMVFRLAEQYLIRAEARAEKNNLEGSIEDLDKIRDRGGLPLIKNTNPGINKTSLLTAIQKERRIELFSEWGHRWLDLKRSGFTTEVLKPIKSKWQATDVLYPIPTNERNRNLNISQNDGY
ncbi:SusD family protein [compost metagenome]